MRHIVATILTTLALVTGLRAQQNQQAPVRVDVGGGVILLQSEFGSSTPFNQGLGVTFGVLVKGGLLVRSGVGQVEMKGCATTPDFGFGNDVLCEKDEFVLMDSTAGYLWNRSGRIRPYLRGGAGWIFLDETVHSAFFGGSASRSDNAPVFAYGGGVEIGDNGHTFAFDYLRTTQAKMNLFNAGIEFELSQIRLDYRFRF